MTGPSPGKLRNQIEHESDDRVNREELDALVPVRLTITANERADQHGDIERAEFGTIEGQTERLGRYEIADDHQQGRDKERDLDATAERDSDRQIHLVFAPHRNGRPALRR